MKVLVNVEGRPAALSFDRSGDAVQFRFSQDGEAEIERTASLIEVETGIYSVVVGPQSYEVKIVPGPGCFYVDVEGRHLAVEVRDPRSATRTARSGQRAGRQTVSAPMPGKVVRVLVAAGDPVEPGQGLIVVEAMKMQNEMKSSKAGTVVEVHAAQGETVSPGDVLVVIE